MLKLGWAYFKWWYCFSVTTQEYLNSWVQYRHKKGNCLGPLAGNQIVRLSTYEGGKEGASEISVRLIIYKNVLHNRSVSLAFTAGSRGGACLLIKRSCDKVQSGGKEDTNDKLYFLGGMGSLTFL